jgi:TRAP-type C4-dicarboxylate transport system substrate-binding protein
MITRPAWTLAALGLFASGADAREATLKFSHFLDPESFFQVDVVEPWARELEAKTGGKVKVETFDATSPLGAVTAQAANVKAGKVDIALGLCGAEGDKFPGSSVIELPFLVPSAACGSQALWALYKDGTLADEWKDYHVLALFVHNPGLIHTAEKAILEPADMMGVRLRSPNNTVSAALKHLGAEPVLLQVNDVMPAVQAGRIDGIITNWGNPLQGFNDFMKHHIEIRFYTAVFFIVMNKARYESLAADVRAAIDAISGDAWVAKLGACWDKWDRPVRAGANAPGHTVVVADAARMARWRAALKPVTDQYLDELAKRFPGARAAYEKLGAARKRS